MATEFDNSTTNNLNNINKRPDDINSFFDDSANSGFKFKDLVFLIARNLHWFLIFALIGGVIAYYKVRGEDRVYAAYSSILIRTQNSSGSESFRGSSALNAIQGVGPVVSTVNNEIMVMRSQSNMENMVRKLGLNTSYRYTTKVARRNTTLYKESPVEVSFPGMDEQAYASFRLTPIDGSHVVLDNFGGNIPAMQIALNDTVRVPFGLVMVKPTWRYNDFMNTTITVQHLSLSSVASTYRGRVSIGRDSEKNSILRLSVTDVSAQRAADVLNVLMDVYNQESIADQQRVLDYTEKFINDRIEFLMNDIDEYEQVSVKFKQSHNIIDTRSYGQAYVAAST